MQFKYKNYELELEEDVETLKEEIEELKRLDKLIDESAHFNILSGKTQAIGKNKIESMRSRKEYSENIVTITKRFIKGIYETVVDEESKDTQIYKLNLERELLYAQISSKAHDWGHTPFGHLGERILNKCIQHTHIEKENLQKILARKKEIYGEQYEKNQGHTEGFNENISFEHNEQSAKIIYDFVHQNSIDLNKINLQRIIDAILAHSTSRVKQEFIPKDIVAQTLRQVDKIEEYTINDFEETKDLINPGIITDKKLSSYLELPKSERIKVTLQQLLEEALEKGCIDDEMESLEFTKKMKKIYGKNMFFMDTDGKRGLLTGENEERITLMLQKVFEYYMRNKNHLPDKTLFTSYPVTDDIPPKRVLIQRLYDKKMITPEERVIDYISQMDNEKVERTYYKLVKERILNGKGKGINPITPEEIEKTKEKTFIREIAFKRVKESNDGVEHSRKECIRHLEYEIQQLKENNLTQKAMKRIEEVRRLHEEENQKDVELCKLVEEYDKNSSKREEYREIERPKKMQETVKEIKKNWKQPPER